jgi:hypothetical protein
MSSLKCRSTEIIAQVFYRYRFLSSLLPRYRHFSHYAEIFSSLRRLNLFDPTYYLDHNPDVAAAGMDPLLHYVKFGATEGRSLCPLEAGIAKLAAVMQGDSPEARADLFPDLSGHAVASRLRQDPVVVLCSSGGNSFFQDARDLVAAGMAKAGLQVQAADETFEDFSSDQIYFIVAPHEFFHIGQGVAWRDKNIFSRTILLTTEQVGTTWFSQSLPYCCQAALIFDIDYAHARLLRSLGLPAYFLPLGYAADFTKFAASGPLPRLPALEGLPVDCHGPPGGDSEDWDSRPLDLSFVGTLFPRREQFFVQHAGFFAKYPSFFYFRRLDSGHAIQEITDGLNAAALAGIARRTKITLNIHQSDLPYFEWFRIVLQGLWHQSLVLTEPSYPVPGLREGEDYLTAELWNFPATIRWLLETDTGRRRAREVAAAGHEKFIRTFSSERIFAWIAPPRGKSSA